jgi:hypothetical protein
MSTACGPVWASSSEAEDRLPERASGREAESATASELERDELDAASRGAYGTMRSGRRVTTVERASVRVGGARGEDEQTQTANAGSRFSAMDLGSE